MRLTTIVSLPVVFLALVTVIGAISTPEIKDPLVIGSFVALFV
jgi:hypothetical protein